MRLSLIALHDDILILSHRRECQPQFRRSFRLPTHRPGLSDTTSRCAHLCECCQGRAAVLERFSLGRLRRLTVRPRRAGAYGRGDRALRAESDGHHLPSCRDGSHVRCRRKIRRCVTSSVDGSSHTHWLASCSREPRFEGQECQRSARHRRVRDREFFSLERVVCSTSLTFHSSTSSAVHSCGKYSGK